MAQLGARLTGSQEVRSSILLRSTIKISLPIGRDIFMVHAKLVKNCEHMKVRFSLLILRGFSRSAKWDSVANEVSGGASVSLR